MSEERGRKGDIVRFGERWKVGTMDRVAMVGFIGAAYGRTFAQNTPLSLRRKVHNGKRGVVFARFCLSISGWRA